MARAPSTAGASPALHGQRRIAGGKLSIAFAVSVRLAARRRSGAPITGSTAPRPFSCIISTPQLARRKRLASNGNGGNVELTDCHRHPARPPPGGHRPADGAALHRGMVAARGPGLQPHRRWRRRRVVGCDPVGQGGARKWSVPITAPNSCTKGDMAWFRVCQIRNGFAHSARTRPARRADECRRRRGDADLAARPRAAASGNCANRHDPAPGPALTGADGRAIVRQAAQ